MRRFLLTTLAAILVLLPAAAVAQVNVYSVSGGYNAPASGTWSGTYAYDAANSTVVSLSIQTTSGFATDGATTLPANTFVFTGFSNASFAGYATAVPATGLRGGSIQMSPSVGSPTGVLMFVDGICLTDDCSSVQTLPASSRLVTSGGVSLLGTLPAITGLAPATSPIAGGVSVVVTGTDFTGATAVTFGGVPGTGLVVDSPTQITVTSPPHAAGTVDVQVTTPIGASINSAADDFSYAVPASVPTMTEWAMILFSLILAGGAALYIERRRRLV